MFKKFKEYHYYILNHWQVPDKRFCSFDASFAFIMLSGLIFGVSFMKSPFVILNNISKITCKYIAFLCVCVSVILLYYGLFTTKFNFKFLNKHLSKFKLLNKLILSNIFKNIFTWLFHLLVVFTIIVAAPFIISLLIIAFIVSKRAKKIDNLLNMNIFVIIISIIIIIFLFPLFIISFYISDFIYNILQKLDFSCDLVAVAIFLAISLLKFLTDITLCIILRIFKWYRQRRKVSLNSMNSESCQELDYDFMYFKNTMRRLQILILVIFLILTLLGIVPNIFLEYQSQLLNVLTVYTVMMLYIDKRKEM